MHNHKDILRTGIIVLLALSIMLSMSISSHVSPGYAQQPFQTLPPINATFTPPVNSTVPLPTPLPTIGPGKYFEKGDDLPEVTRPDLLEELFGYSEIVGDPGLFLVWSTDQNGNKHYFVIDEKNRYFEKIMTAVDNVHKEYVVLINNDTKGKLFRNRLKALGGAFFTGLCGGGTVVSLLASPISAPLTGVLATCTGAAAKFTNDSYNSAIDNFALLKGYAFLEEETRKNIEGFFVQIPYSIQD